MKDEKTNMPNRAKEMKELSPDELERVSGGTGEEDAPRESELDKGGETTGGVGGYGDKSKRRD